MSTNEPPVTLKAGHKYTFLAPKGETFIDVHPNKARTRAVIEVSKTVVVPPVDPPPVEPPPTNEPVFLSRPTSNNVVINGGTDVEITNKTFRGNGGRDNPVGIGITLRNVKRAWIHHNDCADLIGWLYTSNCEDIRVEDNRGRNIGDGTIGAGHSNYIQFADTSGGAIRRNRFQGGWTEDMISTWHSGGWGAGRELIIEDNHIQGLVTDTATTRAWKRGSGTGIILSDGAGNARNGWIILRNNTLLTPGQVGIQIIDGPGLQVLNNIVFGEKRPGNNNPMTTWEGNPSGIATGQRYSWTNDDGSHPAPWKHSNNGMVFSGNTDDRTLNASDYVVVL
jgi:hypothetical protein